jgi:hypothetical protein
LLHRLQGGEDVQQWQEEEFQRKLRGEYEAAQRSISDVVSSIAVQFRETPDTSLSRVM